MNGESEGMARKRQASAGRLPSIVEGICMKKIEAKVFKATCLAIVDHVRAKRETAVITKSGKAVAKLVPVNTDAHEIYGFLAGKGSIAGDIISPAISANDWSAPN